MTAVSAGFRAGKWLRPRIDTDDQIAIRNFLYQRSTNLARARNKPQGKVSITLIMNRMVANGVAVTEAILPHLCLMPGSAARGTSKKSK